MAGRLRTTVALVALLAAGCSFMVNTSDRAQCSTDADCDANPALAGRVCQAGFCALRPSPVSEDAGSGCVDTKICTQANSGRASVCKQAGTPCVEWQVPGCPAITGDWMDPNAIIIGSLLPFEFAGPGGAVTEVKYTQRLQRAIDLAVQEIADEAPVGFFVGNALRKVAVLHCDTRGNGDRAKELFSHLTDVVGAPAVIVGWDTDMLAVSALAQEKGTAVVCSDCLAPLPPEPRVWRVVPSLAGDAALVAWRVAELEAQITAQTPGDIRVAVLVDGARAQSFFLDELAKVLTFNGVGVAGNTPARYLPIKTPDPRTEFVDHDAVAAQIAAFQPHIVVAGMASDFPNYHLPRIEAKLDPGAPRPYYVVTQISYDAVPFGNVLQDDALRARVSGTCPYVTPERALNVARYEQNYRATFTQAANGNASGYEAFYALSLAIAARSGQPKIDGAEISTGFQSLVSGPVFDIGPGINTAFTALANGPVDIRGLFTDLDWDLATGEVASDMGMFCFGKDENGSVVLRDVPGVRWSAATKQTSGTYSCPP